MSIEFKTDRIRTEYSQLGQKNKGLLDMLLDVASFCKEHYGKDIVITSIYRTPEENAALYIATPPDKRPTHAPHTTWQAFDLRSYTFEPEEIDAILAYTHQRYKNTDQRTSAFCHCIIGGAYHFHFYRQLEAQSINKAAPALAATYVA